MASANARLHSQPVLNSSPPDRQDNSTRLLINESLLPSPESTTLRLVQLTEKENLRQLHNNGVAWKGPLSIEQYIRREDVLSHQDLTRNGGLTSWALTDSSLPKLDNGERVVLSGCESFYKRALVKRVGSDNVEDVSCHGIGSVFCPVEFRRRGYTATMLKMLAKSLEKHRPENAKRKVAFSVLYSDIGKEFYAKSGWEPFKSTHISLPAQSTETPVADVRLPLTKPIESQDLPTLCLADEKMLRRWFERQKPKGKHLAALIPDVQTIMWLHAREDFVCQEVLSRYPTVKGALVSFGEGKRAWCYWTRMCYNENGGVEDNTFHILRLVVEDGIADTEEGEVAVAALFHAAQREAGLWNMEKVQIWNPSEQTVKAAARALGKPVGEVEMIDRVDDSIASLLWYGSEVQSGKTSRDVVEWVANEKFGWC